MRNLYRTTASLLREYPILWLPALLAEALIFTIHWFEGIFRRWLTIQLVHWQSQTHSVLSTSPIYANPTQHGINHIILLLTPLQWGIGYLCDVIFACALVATASILRGIPETSHMTPHPAMAAITASRRRILIFALKMYGLGLISSLLVRRFLISHLPAPTFPFQSPWERTPWESLKFQMSAEKMELPSTLSWLAVGLCIAFVIAPIAVKLLKPPDSTLTPQQASRARFAAYLAIAAGTVLQFLHQLIQALLPPLYSGSASTFSIILITVLILALPNLPLFIAYTLIANPESLPADQPLARLTNEAPLESTT